MNCIKCGKKLNDTAAFCPVCGTPCSPESGARQDRKKTSILKIVIPAVAAIAAVAALLIIIPKLIPASAIKASDDHNAAISESSEGSEAVNSEGSETVAPPSVSYEDLQANLEEAYAAVEAAWTQESNVDTGTSKGNMEQKAANYNELQQTLSNLQSQEVSLAAHDDKLQSAVLSYYDMATKAAEVRSEYYSWYPNFIFNDKFLIYRPDLFDASKTEQENYDNISTWYESAKTEYADFTYPSFVEAYWKEYENILELNWTVINKYALACNLNDHLRHRSCQELFDRCEAVEDNWFQETLGKSIQIVSGYSNKLYTYSGSLYAEIQDYIGMSETEREAYAFINNPADELFYGIDWVDTIYPSLYNAYDSLVVMNFATYGGQRDIDIEIEIPGFTQKCRSSYKITDTIKQLFIKPPLLTGDLDLAAAKAAQINITLYEQDGTQIVTCSEPITIKSKNDVEWSSSEYGIFTKDNILCFLTPESTGISSLKRSAIDEITRLTGGSVELFPGYQGVLSSRYAVTYLQAAALMRAMYNTGVRYNMDYFSVSGSTSFYRIRFLSRKAAYVLRLLWSLPVHCRVQACMRS